MAAYVPKQQSDGHHPCARYQEDTWQSITECLKVKASKDICFSIKRNREIKYENNNKMAA